MPPVEQLVIAAIAAKRLIEFHYKGTPARVVEPHDFGERNGIERVLCYQIGGASRTGTARGWKTFDLDGMAHVRLLEQTFAGSRSDPSQRHRKWDRLFARVT